MQPTRAGALAAFILTVQFLLTLLWIVVAWPPEGFGGLADAMAEYFRSRIDQPVVFAAMNLYNVSFALSAVGLGVVLRRQFSDFPHAIDFAFFNIVIAGALYVASGVVPLIAAPELLHANDESALNAIELVGVSLLLGATMCSGFAVTIFSLVAFRSGRVPMLLCTIMLCAGIIEIVEWAVPVILVLDPLLGTFWSLWLGVLLWQDRLGSPQRVAGGRSVAGPAGP